MSNTLHCSDSRKIFSVIVQTIFSGFVSSMRIQLCRAIYPSQRGYSLGRVKSLRSRNFVQILVVPSCKCFCLYICKTVYIFLSHYVFPEIACCFLLAEVRSLLQRLIVSRRSYYISISSNAAVIAQFLVADYLKQENLEHQFLRPLRWISDIRRRRKYEKSFNGAIT